MQQELKKIRQRFFSYGICNVRPITIASGTCPNTNSNDECGTNSIIFLGKEYLFSSYILIIWVCRLARLTNTIIINRIVEKQLQWTWVLMSNKIKILIMIHPNNNNLTLWGHLSMRLSFKCCGNPFSLRSRYFKAFKASRAPDRPTTHSSVR